VPAADIHCTEVGSAGILSTPVVDLASRALFLGRADDARWRHDQETVHHFS
jgi:hypothetical protein